MTIFFYWILTSNTLQLNFQNIIEQSGRDIARAVENCGGRWDVQRRQASGVGSSYRVRRNGNGQRYPDKPANARHDQTSCGSR